MIKIPRTMSDQEVKTDLLAGLYKRLGQAAWGAKGYCEDITKDNAAGGWDAIRFARERLKIAEQCLIAIRELEGDL